MSKKNDEAAKRKGYLPRVKGSKRILKETLTNPKHFHMSTPKEKVFKSFTEYWKFQKGYISDPNKFAHAVLEPLKAEGAWKYSTADKAVAMVEKWDATFQKLHLRMAVTNFENLPKNKQIKNMDKKLKDVMNTILNSPELFLDFEYLMPQIVKGFGIIDDRKAKRSVKRQQDYIYPPGVILTAKELLKYWQKMTGSKKKLSGYSKYYEYEEKGIIPQIIDVKHNPGGAFFQRVFETYFGKKYNNPQITTLLNKVYDKK